MADPRVTCRTPNPGRSGTTAIPQWKFDAVRSAICTALADGPVPFRDLPDAVKAEMNADDLNRLGSLGWHVTTVKLELEVRGEIERLVRPGPQRIRLVE